MITDGVTIQLLGGFQITTDGAALGTFSNTRLQSVLAYIILSRNAPQSRQHLAFLFWPDSTDSQARTNLRNVLHLLRNQLPTAEHTLAIDSTTVHWRPNAPIVVDIIRFDQALRVAQNAHDPALKRAALEEAVALYAGDLLPGCYDEWILSARAEWQQRYISVMEQLIDLLDHDGEYRTALDHAQRLHQYDPLLETTYVRLMQLHAALGDRAAALRIYHLCRTTLDRELGVEPSPTTQAIYERLLKLEAPATPVETLRLATPLVGRAAAWGELQEHWQRMLQGNQRQDRIQFIMVNGEAGIGKTRLAEALTETLQRQGMAVATATCYPAGGRLAFAPLQSWLRAPDIVRQRQQVSVRWQQELARLLPELATEEQEVHVPSPVTDAAHRHRLFEAVLQALTVGQAPLLLVLDDIQWCDRDTLEWLEFLMHSGKQAPNLAPILVLATLRSGETTADDPLSLFRRTLERSGHLHDLHLGRLSELETGQLVTNLIGKDAAHQIHAIFEATDGIPLFIVETVRANRQSQSGNTESGAEAKANFGPPLPPKILSVIEGRLVRLSPDARALADLAAVIGQAFNTNLIMRATTLGEDELVQGLDELWQQQIIKEQAGSMEETYAFVHDKLREVLYSLLSPMRRRLLHRRIAQALEELSQESHADASAQIAAHHEQAGQVQLAIGWLQRAAQAAHRLSALQDALGHLNHALALLQTVGDGISVEKRSALELSIQMQRGAIYLATKGHAAPEVEQSLNRAFDLCQAGGTVEQRFAVLYGLGRYYLVRPALEKGMAVAQQLLQLAEASQSSDLLIEAYMTLGTYLLHRAAFPEALDYLQRAIALYDQNTHGNHTVRFGQDPGVVSLSYSAWVHWCRAEIEPAKSKTQQAITLADALGYPYNRAIAQTYAAVQWQYADDAATCLVQAESASALATTQGFTLWQAMADFLRGWSQARLGSADKGIALMTASANLFQATGAELGACYFAALLAETLANQGKLEPAIAAMNDAFDLLERTQDRWCAAELHRIHGELLLQQGQTQVAKAAFETGLQIAQEQGAGWWEERCRQALARLNG